MSDIPKNDPFALIPLTPAAFHIALALAGGARHGYGIMRDIERMGRGAFGLGSGTLYRSLQKMQGDGLVEEFYEAGAVAGEDEPRRFFKLTELGAQVTVAEARRLEDLVAIARDRGLFTPRKGRRVKPGKGKYHEKKA